MKRIIGILFLAISTLITHNACADPVPFEEANKLYEEGHYLDAINAYRSLLTSRPTLAIYFNLGNAYFKSGQLGEAIAEYRLAKAIAPRDPDVNANLKFARGQVRGPSYTPGRLERNVRKLTNREWAAVSTAPIWLFFLLMAARQLRPAWKGALLPWTALAALAAFSLTTASLWVSHLRSANKVAVVIQRDTVMRLGPFEESKSVSTLKDGTELHVLDRKDNWLQVSPDGRSFGWITDNSARLVP